MGIEAAASNFYNVDFPLSLTLSHKGRGDVLFVVFVCNFARVFCSMSKHSPLRTLSQAKSLRKRSTDSEATLWNSLRAKKLKGYIFRRQVPINHYIVDFCCFEKKLIIELDGIVHRFKWKQDYLREQYLENRGFRIVRFKNIDIMANLEHVLEQILAALQKNNTNIPSPSDGGGLGRG